MTADQETVMPPLDQERQTYDKALRDILKRSGEEQLAQLDDKRLRVGQFTAARLAPLGNEGVGSGFGGGFRVWRRRRGC